MRTRRPRGEIGLGDLMQALHALGTRDEATVQRIATSLGFAGLDPNPPEHGRGAYDTSRFRPTHGPRRAPVKPPSGPGLPPIAPQPKAPQRLRAMRLEPVKAGPPPSTPAWLQALPRQETPEPALGREPLLSKRTSAGVIGAATATRRPGPDLDVPRLTGLFVSGRPLDRVPRLPVATLERGVQLLVDSGESMTPFRLDTEDLILRFQDVIGRDRCALFDFEADPADAVRWTQDGREQAWRAEPGRPVVLASDLDIGAATASRHRAPSGTWRAFARRCRLAGCPVIAFVPRTPDRWPAGLHRWMSLIHWDPRTSAAAVRRLVGPGHEAGQ